MSAATADELRERVDELRIQVQVTANHLERVIAVAQELMFESGPLRYKPRVKIISDAIDALDKARAELGEQDAGMGG